MKWAAGRQNAARRIFAGRYTGLTIALLLLAGISNIEQRTAVHELAVTLVFFVLVFLAIRSVGTHLRVAAVLLAAPTLIAELQHGFGYSLIPRAAHYVLTTGFLAFVSLVVLYEIMRREVVTADTIVGALCVYFLFGVTWASGYTFLELSSPGSFAVDPALAEAAGWGKHNSAIALMQYYSFATLTTVGADISPLSAAARLATTLEAAIGQLYVAVLIARLVGIHTSRTGGS